MVENKATGVKNQVNPLLVYALLFVECKQKGWDGEGAYGDRVVVLGARVHLRLVRIRIQVGRLAFLLALIFLFLLLALFVWLHFETILGRLHGTYCP